MMGAVTKRIDLAHRGMANSIVGAGGSMGQFIIIPLTQTMISAMGWMAALWGLSLLTLLAMPLAAPFRNSGPVAPPTAAEGTLSDAIGRATRDRSYLLLSAGFFVCGFHVAFIATHMPGVVAACGLSPEIGAWSLAVVGLFNILGTLTIGWAIGRYRMKYLLSALYATRGVAVLLFVLAPKTVTVLMLFSVVIGLTYLATVPPTAGLVGKLFGPRHLATLFGLTLVSHQTGAFFGAWLGGITVSRFGDYTWMWYADIVLAVLAAVCHLPIVEARLPPRLATA
jgi:predicted MFS family arabinose efflux permease